MSTSTDLQCTASTYTTCTCSHTYFQCSSAVVRCHCHSHACMPIKFSCTKLCHVYNYRALSTRDLSVDGSPVTRRQCWSTPCPVLTSCDLGGSDRSSMSGNRSSSSTTATHISVGKMNGRSLITFTQPNLTMTSGTPVRTDQPEVGVYSCVCKKTAWKA